MLYQLAADSLVVFHLLFIFFVIVGGVFVLRWRWLMWVHLPVAIWGALVEFMHWTCPLTPLENYFRRVANGQGYEGGFIEHYIIPIIYPAGLTDGIQIALGVFVIVANAIIYTLVIRRYLHDKSYPENQV